MLFAERRLDDSLSTAKGRGQWEERFCHVVLNDVTRNVNESLNNMTHSMLEDQQKGFEYFKPKFKIH